MLNLAQGTGHPTTANHSTLSKFCIFYYIFFSTARFPNMYCMCVKDECQVWMCRMIFTLYAIWNSKYKIWIAIFGLGVGMPPSAKVNWIRSQCTRPVLLFGLVVRLEGKSVLPSHPCTHHVWWTIVCYQSLSSYLITGLGIELLHWCNNMSSLLSCHALTLILINFGRWPLLSLSHVEHDCCWGGGVFAPTIRVMRGLPKLAHKSCWLLPHWHACPVLPPA
jgi:hypothetical protein